MNVGDLCDLCVLPAVSTVTFRDDWRDLSEGDRVQACQPCAEWLEANGLAADIQALPRRALVSAGKATTVPSRRKARR